ncbi:MAG TPA: VIT domain-containing protein [Haliangiales bacterium]|nr:VIT domain-containing protein [Haliangiales bacterium]
MRWLLAGVCLAHAAAAGASSAPAPTEGTLRTRDGKEIVDVPLKHTRADIRVHGVVADVEVEQTFQNPYRQKIEASYLFPLPTRSAVFGYEIRVGGRTIVGELRPRDEAVQKYKAAVRAGHVAALLTQERPNLFVQAVGNIEPGAEVGVKLRYVEPLVPDEGGYELAFPLVAGPRHVPPSSRLAPEAAALVQAPALPAGLRSSHDVEVAVRFDADVPAHDVTSPSHRIDVAGARVGLAAGDTIPNKDFVLRYHLGGEAPSFALLADADAGAGSFFFLAMPPAAAGALAPLPKELVLAVDTSSSMAGAPLAKAKELARRALGALGPDDTFQIVAFDDAATALAPRSVAVKPRNLDVARAWIDALAAGGGTDVAAGVRLALEAPADPGRLRIVVFITDGFVGNEDEILALVQDKIGAARLFTFGVGSAPNRYLLEEMAALGRGAVAFVRADEDAAAAAAAFVRRLARPVLTDLRVDWNGLAVADVTPARIPDLYDGQPLVLFGRFARAGEATVAVVGRRGGETLRFEVPVALPERSERPAVGTMWARARIAELSRRLLRGETPELKKQVMDLALAHHLMTRYTAFVAVDASRKTAGGEAETVAMPVEVPEDVRREAVMQGVGVGGGGVALGTIGHGSGSGVGYGYGAAAAPATTKVASPMVVVERAEVRTTEPLKIEEDELRGRFPDMARCLDDKPTGQLEIAIGADGRVTEAKVTGAPAAVAECLKKQAKLWTFRAGAAATRRVDLAEVR